MFVLAPKRLLYRPDRPIAAETSLPIIIPSDPMKGNRAKRITGGTWLFLRFRRGGGVPVNSRGASFALWIPAERGRRKTVAGLLSERSASRGFRGGAAGATPSFSHTFAVRSLSLPIEGPRSGAGLARSPRWYPESGKRTPRTRLARDARATTDMHPITGPSQQGR